MKKISKHLELVLDAQKGNRNSLFILFLKYKPLIISYTNKFISLYPNTPLEKSDILQHLKAAFWELVMKYNFASPKSFPSYIKQFLLWKGHEEMKKYVSSSMKVMNYYVSFGDDSPFLYEDKQIFDISIFKNITTNLEYCVIKYLIEGYNLTEISKKLQKNKTCVYQTKYRALRKIKAKVGLLNYF